MWTDLLEMFGSILVHLGGSSLPECSSCMHSHCQFISQSIRERLKGINTINKGPSIFVVSFWERIHSRMTDTLQLVNFNHALKISTKISSYFEHFGRFKQSFSMKLKRSTLLNKQSQSFSYRWMERNGVIVFIFNVSQSHLESSFECSLSHAHSSHTRTHITTRTCNIFDYN